MSEAPAGWFAFESGERGRVEDRMGDREQRDTIMYDAMLHWATSTRLRFRCKLILISFILCTLLIFDSRAFFCSIA